MKVSTVAFLAALIGGAIAARSHAGWSEALIFDRLAIARGEGWRWITGHLVHYSWPHLAGDALALLMGGVMSGRRLRLGGVMALATSAMVIPAAIWWCEPGWRYYAGSSGLAATWVAMAAMMAARRPDGRRWFGGLLLALICAKIGWESHTAKLLFAEFEGASIKPAAIAHLVGAFLGMLAGWIEPLERDRRETAVGGAAVVDKSLTPALNGLDELDSEWSSVWALFLGRRPKQ